ncbi:MAG TPA: 16S rRNA (uracil(1498)-N(3))-methyltransferase [Thermoanaerobaculia bacterium]|jgi:16S rRNA (uracil1498-N3)-methyltransferase
MRHRFHLPAALPPGESVTLTGDEAHHAARVVRVREGEEVELFDGRGRAVAGVITTVGRDVVVQLGNEVPSRESRLHLTLAMAIINLEKFELVLQKATELGVRTIVPLVTDRVELRRERYAGKMERWNRVVFEAVKQCGRSVIPALKEPARFEDVVGRDGTRILFDLDESPAPATKADAVTLLIGPEGGWSERELALARERGVYVERLGPRRLRAETAAIVAGTIVAQRWGDLTES